MTTEGTGVDRVEAIARTSHTSKLKLAAAVSGITSLAMWFSISLVGGPIDLTTCNAAQLQPSCREVLPSSIRNLAPAAAVVDHRLRRSLTADRLGTELEIGSAELEQLLLGPPPSRPSFSGESLTILERQAALSWSSISWRPYDLEVLRSVHTPDSATGLQAVLNANGGPAALADAANKLLAADPGYALERQARIKAELANRQTVFDGVWSSYRTTTTSIFQRLVAMATLLGLACMLALVGIWRRRPLMVRVTRHHLHVGSRMVMIEDLVDEQPGFTDHRFQAVLKSGEVLELPADHRLTDPDRAAILAAVQSAVRTGTGEEAPPEHRAALQSVVEAR